MKYQISHQLVSQLNSEETDFRKKNVKQESLEEKYEQFRYNIKQLKEIEKKKEYQLKAEPDRLKHDQFSKGFGKQDEKADRSVWRKDLQKWLKIPKESLLEQEF